jgi:hypothetical protein
MLADMASLFPPRSPDPFDLLPRYRPGNLMGMDVIESPDVPRYTLPDEVIPGVPWPPGFRDEINKWSREFLGTTNMLPRNTMYVIANRALVMRPSDVVKITGLL